MIDQAKASDIAKAIGMPLERAQLWLPAINATSLVFDISTAQRMAAFLAQVAYESDHFAALSENLNYTAQGLLRTFPHAFPTTELADEYAHQPERIANRVYANRYGNGDEASGDGWKYRGRGLIQITFKDNYHECGDALKLDLIGNPAYLIRVQTAADSAGWYWYSRHCNALADAGQFGAITREINGGENGLSGRLALYQHLLAVIGG